MNKKKLHQNYYCIEFIEYLNVGRLYIIMIMIIMIILH